MRRLLFSAIAAAAAFTLLSISPPPAHAASELMCAPDRAGAARGPRQVKNPVTGTTYNLGPNGCALFAAADIGWAKSQGYTPGPPFGSIVATGITANGLVGTVPASAYIREIIVQNSSANAVTGGVGFGKTAAATDVVTALTCAANCLTFVADSAIKLRVFASSQPLYLSAVTDFNSAVLNVTVVYGYY